MTFAELKADVVRRLNESSTPVFWTDADVSSAINEGYQDISDATRWNEKSITIDLLEHRPAYDLRALTGDTVLSVGRAYNDQTSRWLEPVSIRTLDQTRRQWETTTGEPAYVWARGLWWVCYYPRVAADGGTVTQYYTALPDPLVEDADEPGFPASLHEGLVAYALADLRAQDAEPKRATQAWQSYLAYEANLTRLVQGRASVPLEHGLV